MLEMVATGCVIASYVLAASLDRIVADYPVRVSVFYTCTQVEERSWTISPTKAWTLPRVSMDINLVLPR